MARGIDHHLQQHGKGFRVVKEIPAPLRAHFNGRRFLIKSLGAVTAQQARLLRGPVLADFELEIAHARNAEDPVLFKARRLRGRIEEVRYATNLNETNDPSIDAARLADEIEATRGPEAAEAIHGLMEGITTPLDEHLDAWIEDEKFNGKVALLHRSAFKQLAVWLDAKNVRTTLQAVTPHLVWEFIEKELKPGSAIATVNRKLSTYRTHWRWLKRRHRIEVNPWLDTNQKIIRKSHIRNEDEGKRAFTDDEVRALLSGVAPGVLPDLMRIAALTGARIDAICQLRVRDCANKTFTFKRAKKEPHDRTIPQHSDLKKVVARRTKGKSPDHYLFDELPAATSTRPRSASASQAFTRYRRSLSIGAPEGDASDVDFHSWRRWFTTKAEQASQPPHIIDFVTGHKRPGETLGRYSKGPSLEQMRACVEAIKLPKHSPACK